MSKNFYRSNAKEEPVSTHDEDDGSSTDAEIKALKAQLKRVKQDASKLKKENLKLKTLLVMLSLFLVMLAHMFFENLKVNDVLSLP